jgi:hypothetical protein
MKSFKFEKKKLAKTQCVGGVPYAVHTSTHICGAAAGALRARQLPTERQRATGED